MMDLFGPAPCVNPPAGFGGNNGLWLQADVVQAKLTSRLVSGEINARLYSDPYGTFQVIAGCRYFDLKELAQFMTNDDGLTANNLVNAANYYTDVHNRLLGPQLGCEAHANLYPWLTLSVVSKGALGANFLDARVRLRRGDNLVGLAGDRSGTTFSHLYEGGAYVDIRPWQQCLVRVGFQALWAVHFASAPDQISFDLSLPNGNPSNDRNIVYYGPSLLVELNF